jgi:hypothetical protein
MFRIRMKRHESQIFISLLQRSKAREPCAGVSNLAQKSSGRHTRQRPSTVEASYLPASVKVNCHGSCSDLAPNSLGQQRQFLPVHRPSRASRVRISVASHWVSKALRIDWTPSVGKVTKPLSRLEPLKERKIIGMPAVVIPRGGKYFFSPSLKGLKSTIACVA